MIEFETKFTLQIGFLFRYQSNNQHFTHTDVNTFEAFAIFCGLGIHNTQLYEGACKGKI